MKKIAIYLISFYQKNKFWKTKYCRHFPTCSNYSKEAFKTHNFFYAFYLTTKRILKCNPFFKGGYDPVPKSKKKNQ